MPDAIAKGRGGVRACGFCHLPNGRGRPENASPAGYTASYIVQQMMDYKNGLRRSSDPRKNNVNLMASYAKEATDEEIKAAAEYFAALAIPQGWITVKEVAMVPKTKIAGNVYFELEGAQAGDGAQQGGLSGAVRPGQRGQAAGREAVRQRVDDRPPLVSQGRPVEANGIGPDHSAQIVQAQTTTSTHAASVRRWAKLAVGERAVSMGYIITLHFPTASAVWEHREIR